MPVRRYITLLVCCANNYKAVGVLLWYFSVQFCLENHSVYRISENVWDWNNEQKTLSRFKNTMKEYEFNFGLKDNCDMFYRVWFKLILYSYLILKKMNERITDS